VIVTATRIAEGSLGSPTADVALEAAARDALLRGTSRTVEIEGRSVFVEAFPVKPRLVVVGAVEVARSLVRLARELGYETVVIDGRASFATPERFPPETVDRLIVGWPDEVADEIGLGPDDAVAVLTHDVKFDEPAIVEALRRGCRYVGAVGSRKTQGDRRERLRAAGVTDDELARLRGPVGLDLGGRAPAETALAIMAEVVAERYGGSGRPMVETAKGLGAPGGVTSTAAATPIGAAAGDDRGRRPCGGRGEPLRLPEGACASRWPADPRACPRRGPRCRDPEVVVVLGHAADEIEDGIQWLDEHLVRNPDPRHLSSSLQVGVAAAAALEPAPSAVVIVLGDQPRTRAEVIRALIAAARSSDRPVIVPRYADGGGANPVLLREAAFELVDEASGDHGLGPLLASDPDVVLEVPVPGSNPDIDTPDDLRRLEEAERARWTYREAMTTATASALEDAWAERVRANREQVDKVREVPDRDFYAPVSSLFVADPRRTGEEALDALLDLAEPEDRWLDIGAGAGRYALPLAAHVAEVIAVEPSVSMRNALRTGKEEHGIDNLRIVAGAWPAALAGLGSPRSPRSP
jgi:xanthine dehydrogenase accessory factor